MVPDWPSLWAREPALTPVGLEDAGHMNMHPDSTPRWTIAGGCNCCETCDGEAMIYGESSTVADLCAMRAVRWLANERKAAFQRNADAEAAHIAAGNPRFSVPPGFLENIQVVHTILNAFTDMDDAALHAACRAALDVRGKK
jgi:hypothetical protein